VTSKTPERRLAAIMFTDMVGYSALSQRVWYSDRTRARLHGMPLE
jgi:hypothetical protein